MGLLPRRDEKRINRWYFGGAAAAAASCFTHPLDLLKVLLQTQQNKANLKDTIQTVYQNNGIRGFYNGISAALMRQLTYTNSRVAIYEVGKEMFGNDTFAKKTLLSLAAGTLSAAVGTPMDVVNVRMQNDMKLPMEQRRNYKHVFDGLILTHREGGFNALFAGATFAVVRGVLMTMGQNVVYDEVKAFFKKSFDMKDGVPLHMCSSVCAALVATVMTQPVDVVKTRKMNAKRGEFVSNFDVVTYTAKEGPMAFFKGTVPAFLRLGPQVILFFIFMEQLRLYFGYFKTKEE